MSARWADLLREQRAENLGRLLYDSEGAVLHGADRSLFDEPWETQHDDDRAFYRDVALRFLQALAAPAAPGDG